MTVHLEVPDARVDALAVDGQLERGVFVALVFYAYERGRLSAGKASELLVVSRERFEELRAQRGIPVSYGADHLESDIQWAQRG